jgi:hypothetical protein
MCAITANRGRLRRSCLQDVFGPDKNPSRLVYGVASLPLGVPVELEVDPRGVHLMSAAWNRNRLTTRLGIDYPVIQGPLGGLSSQRLTAAVSNFGGLGSFGAHTLAPAAIEDAIAQIRALTSNRSR